MERLTNVEIKEFLKDFKDTSETLILEEGKEKEEIIQIAKAKGINLKNNRDLAGFKNIYAFANKANKNKVRLPKEILLKALPTMIGKPVDIDHNRSYVIGHYIDYRYNQKDDKVISYGLIYKSNFEDEWENVKKLFKAKKLSTSFEIWCPKEKRNYLKDGTYELLEQDIAGGAILFKQKPAFKDAKVLELAKEHMTKNADLVYASQYKCKDLIVHGEIPCSNCGKCKSVTTQSSTISLADTTDGDITDSGCITTNSNGGTTQIVKETEELKQKIVNKPQISKIKCSNCGEVLEYNGIDIRIKCLKCFAILNKEGTMQYPPQIKDFSMLCPSCKIDNWLILAEQDKSTKIKCQSCSKEYKVEFAVKQRDLVDKIDFLYTANANCLQCNTSIPFTGISNQEVMEVKCKRCGLEFSYNIRKEGKKQISKIIEISDEIIKSSKGGIKMEFTLELSKFHRLYDGDIDQFLKNDVKVDYDKDSEIEEAKRLTYEQRKALPDNAFAVVIRVKDKRTGKMRKIRMYPIYDKAHVRNALARLGQPKPQATLKRLGLSVEAVRRKVLRKAKALGMTELLERYKKANIDAKLEKLLAQIPKAIADCVRTKTKAGTKSTIAVKECWAEFKKTQKAEDITNSEKKIDDFLKTSSEKIEKEVKKDTRDKEIAELKKTVEDIKKKLESSKKEVEEAKKKVSLYETNAQKIIKRREELGEEYANKLSDEDILNDDKFGRVKVEKENILLKAKIENKDEDDIVGTKIEEGSDEYYEKYRKEIDNKAFPKK